MDPSFQAEAVISAGRGALIVAMFGAGWLGWGLGDAKAFNGFIGPAFGFTALFLWACSIYFIQKGRLLRKKYPAVGASTRQTILKWYLLIVLLEVLAIFSRFDLGESTPSRRPGARLVCDDRGPPFSATCKDLPSASSIRPRDPDDALVRSLVGAVSLEYDRDLSLAWNWNPALGHLCLRIVSSPTNRAIT
jgi:hypothetical protein